MMMIAKRRKFFHFSLLEKHDNIYNYKLSFASKLSLEKQLSPSQKSFNWSYLLLHIEKYEQLSLSSSIIIQLLIVEKKKKKRKKEKER